MKTTHLPLSAKDPSKWKMEPVILVSLAMECATEKANKYGTISLFMRVTGWTIEPMAEADSFMQMEMYIKESGKTTKLMVMEFILVLINLTTLDNGAMIFNMDTAYKSGTITLLMKDSIFKASNKDMENSLGQMDRFMKATLRKI